MKKRTHRLSSLSGQNSQLKRAKRPGRSLHLQSERLEDRMLMAVGPQLLGINPSNGGLLLEGSKFDVAPHELTFRFDENQVIDAATLGGIRVVRAGGDGSLSDSSNIVVQPGFKGIGSAPNEVIVRFAERLPDDLYRIDIIGAGADALKNKKGEAFNGGQNASRSFDLNLGAQVVSVVPQPVIRSAGQLTQREDQIVVYFNNDDLRDGADGAENPNFYKLIFTNTTAFNGDDKVFSPTSVDYDPALDRSILTFAKPIAELAGTGIYRLRIGTNEQVASSTNPLTPTRTTPAADPRSSFDTAHSLGTLSGSVIVSEAITAQSLPLDFPGSSAEPGHREFRSANHILTGADPVDGVTLIPYNFQINYGRDPQGNQLFNVISANQKQRVREALELYSNYLGVQFYETAAHGITIATGDLRVVGGLSRPGGSLGDSFGTIDPLSPPPGPLDPPANPFQPKPMVVMDAAENWDDKAGGDFFQTAMRYVGQILGLANTFDLPGPSVMGHDPEMLFSQRPNPLLVQPIGEGIYAAGTFRDELPIDPITVIHGQHLYRPDSIDIDMYRFQVSSAGRFSVETIAERLTDSSALDTLVSVYREKDGKRELIARNDDYFSEDSFLELDLVAGTYFVAVSARGNDQFDPAIENTGANGTSQGKYDLRLNFRPVVDAAASLRDLDVTGVSPAGTLLDGDADGAPGGIFNFWFRAVANSSNTANPRSIFVDKSFTGGNSASTLGSLARPYSNLGLAAAAARPGDILRVVGNGGTDGNLTTVGDNRAYEIGATTTTPVLTDGSTLNVPKGVTLMIDAGAILKMSRTSINVGSFSPSIDLSGSAIQVLGTPNSPVIFTSISDRTTGTGNLQLPVTAKGLPGDWGGIIIRNDNDRAQGRFDYEQQAIFLNHINQANIRYGGGRVTINSVPQVINPIHLFDARPTIAYNSITSSADAAISANPDSFEESNFHARDSVNANYQNAGLFTSDYTRVGPDIHGNRITDNTTNGLFVRIQTLAGQQVETLTVTGRFNDTDITHVVTESLRIDGTPGGSEFVASQGLRRARLDAHLIVDPGLVVKLRSARIEVGLGAAMTAEGTSDRRIVMTSLFDTRYGAGGTFATSRGNNDGAVPQPGDWSGVYAGAVSSLSLDQAVIAYGGGLSGVEGAAAAFNAIEIHQAHARIANSTIEWNSLGTGGQAAKVRAGRGTNESAAIFVRGANPIIIDNVIRNTQGANTPALSVDLTTLSHDLNPDWGRSRGEIDLATNTKGNHGALVRDNRLADNGINGMVVRGGTLLTEGVWDDTTIVHVLLDEVVIPDLHTFGGLRLESSSDQSLVVKTLGPQAGIRATGFPLETEDRVGGMLHVLGQPGSPVVMTSLADDTVGAGVDPAGRPQNDTDGGGRPLPTRPDGTFQIDVIYGPVARSKPAFVEAVEAAVRIWERLLNDPITVTLDVEIQDLPEDRLGEASSEVVLLPYDQVRTAMLGDARGRGHESVVEKLPTFPVLQSNAVLPTDPSLPFTLANTVRVNRANALALGFPAATLPGRPSLYDPKKVIDATVRMNVNPWRLWPDGTPALFDNDSSDGIIGDRSDTTGVVVHEIGHALGFVSAVDDVDVALQDRQLPRNISMTTLDLFRLGKGAGAEDFTRASRLLDPSLYHVFYDGGFFDPSRLTVPGLNIGDVPLSTGKIHGDAENASHWKLIPGLGAMVPGLPNGYEQLPTEQDRQALDLIGYDVVGGAIPGDWRGLILETASHDRNVAAVTEQESLGVGGTSVTDPTVSNNTAETAQFVGALASKEGASDDNLRLGFEIFGQIHATTDLDVYSFDAVPGTEVWFDIDQSSVGFDSVIELIGADEEVLARSGNSLNEMTSFPEFVKPGVFAAGLQRSVYGSVDYWSQNIFDAGMRVVLPGGASTSATYHVRVRSAGANSSALSDPGVTSGAYKLSIRLREVDEHAGSTVQYAEIGYAIDGIRLRGVPLHSPLSGEVTEDGTPNSQLAGESGNNRACIRQTTRTALSADPCAPTFFKSGFSDAQYVGNLLSTDRDTITIAGKLSNSSSRELSFGELADLGADAKRQEVEGPGDVDWYLFEVSSPTDVIFDVDYADGVGGPNTSLQVYRAAGVGGDLRRGELVYSSLSGHDPDDLPRPQLGADLTDLSRGSANKLDPFLGPARLGPSLTSGTTTDLSSGFYLLRISTAYTEPIEQNQFAKRLPVNTFIRMSPIDAGTLLVNDPISEDPLPGIKPILDPVASVVPLTLGDLVLYAASNVGSADAPQTQIVTIDPFTGRQETVVGDFGIAVGDIAFRNNDKFFNRTKDVDEGDKGNKRIQRLHAFSQVADGLAPKPTDAAVGNYLSISPEDAKLLPDGAVIGDDGIETFVPDPDFVPDPADPTAQPDPIPAEQPTEGKGGIQFDAYAFDPTIVDYQTGFAIGHRADFLETNIIYKFNSVTGAAIGEERKDDDLLPKPNVHAGTKKTELGILANVVGDITGMTFVGNRLFAVSNVGRLYEILNFDSRPAARFIANSIQYSGTPFSSLTVVPEGHALAGTLIASTATDLYAFDTNANPKKVFMGGASRLSFVGQSLVGIAFAPQPENTWHVTSRRGGDTGHNIDPLTSGNSTSFYLGEKKGNQDTSRNINFAGGFQGTIISKQLDLSGYTADDDPYLYFNYLLSAEEAYRDLDNEFPGAQPPARDSFRVFVSDNDTADGQGSWHLVATNQLPRDFDADVPGSASEYNSLDDPRVPQVQPLFDNTFQDVPVYAAGNAGSGGTATRNGLRDAFPSAPFDPDGQPWDKFQQSLDETDTAWRQARISLKGFVGSSDLRLRFEFTTAGSMDYGFLGPAGTDGGTGGVELHAVAGSRLRDGDTFRVGSGATAKRFEFDLGQSITTVGGGAITDGQVLTVSPTVGAPLTLEFDTNGVVRPGSIRVPVTATSTAVSVATGIVSALKTAQPSLVVSRIENRVAVTNASFTTDTQFVVVGNTGVASGNEPIVVSQTMTAEDVAKQIQTAVAKTLANDSLLAVPRFESIVRIIGFAVPDPGPLGLADALPGDEFGSYYNKLRGIDNQSRTYGGEEGGFTVAYEGVYLDDIVVGFASRGERVTNLRTSLCALTSGKCSLSDAEIAAADTIPDVFAIEAPVQSRNLRLTESFNTEGSYQVEIRRAGAFEIPFDSLNPQDRRSPGTTLFAPAGNALFDGKLLTIADGRNRVVFEFDDALSPGVANGHLPIRFNTDATAFEVASAIRDAVRDANTSGLLNLLAATSDGQASGPSATSRVNLFGNAVLGLDTAPHGIPFVIVDQTGSGNLARDQGQIIIKSNDIRHSANYGIIAEAPPREIPGGTEPSVRVEGAVSVIAPRQEHAQFSHSDYNSALGSARQLVKENTERLAPGATIVNNVVADGGMGGIHIVGDSAGIFFVGPIAEKEVLPTFLFEITDHNGFVQRFSFGDTGEAHPFVSTIPIIVKANRWDDDPSGDSTDALLSAIQTSNLDVTVYRSRLDEIYIAGATAIKVPLPDSPVWFPYALARPVAAANVPFARVLNNTIVGKGGALPSDSKHNAGDFSDVGIFLEQNVSPTLLNNVIVNFKRGIVSDKTSTTTVISGTTFQGNVRNADNINATDFTDVLPNTATPFTDFKNGIFYPADRSRLIDSSIDTVADREDLRLVKQNVGIDASPVLAPIEDLLGQLRVDDPNVEPPLGSGANVFKDRGALERADITGPQASLLTPLDNDGVTDKNNAFTQVRLDTTLLSRFEIRLNDLSDLADVNRGSGVNDSTVTSGSVSVQRDGVTLVDGVDYSFSYDSTNRTIRMTPLAGVWEAGHTYVITLANSGDKAIKDIAGHSLLANQDSGATTFTVEFEVPTDYGDAPDPSYPTLLSRDGARHAIVPTVFLGASVDADVDGQPTSAADGDVDDGVTFSGVLPGSSATFTVTASVNGFLEGWVDYNRDGDWTDSGEQVFNRKAVVPGANVLTVAIPADAQLGNTFARFRFSTAGGLSPTGAAADGEVEDYQVRIGPDAAWQNPANPLDVNNDGFNPASAIDALLVINELNLPTVSHPVTGKLPPITQPPNVPPGYLDVNGDGFVSAIDALLVINELNRISALQQRAVAPTASSVPGPVAAAIPGPTVTTTATVPKSNRNTAIDSLFAGASTGSFPAVPQTAASAGRLPAAETTDAHLGRAKNLNYEQQVAGQAAWSVQDELFTEIAQDVAGRRRRK